MAAAFQFDSVSHANPLRYGLVGVSFMTVSLDCGPVADAHTSFLCIVGTSFISASLCLHTVSKTDASSHRRLLSVQLWYILHVCVAWHHV